jgi:glycosyltransferase involved in cell wall biosynthesis
VRVLISSSTFPLRPSDGLPRFVYDLAEELTSHCEVAALVPHAPGAPLAERMGNVDVRRFVYFLPTRWQSLAYGSGMRDNLRGSWLAKLQPLPFVVAQARAIRGIVRERGIEIVNSHWLVPQGISAALARRGAVRFGHVVTVHAADVYLLRAIPAGRAIARFVARRTESIFADGSHVRDTLDELLGFPSGAVLQPNGVRTEIFGRNAGTTPVESPFPDGFLLFFGRFAEKKGVVYLLRALPKVLEHFPGLGLVLIGYGSLEGQLRDEAARLDIARSVVFAGRKPHTEIVGYLRACRAAVVPSIIDRHGETEGMPTVVVEAMAAGVPVVASAVDGIPDVVRHRRNGWLCREKDPDDLAEKIIDALQDPDSSEIVRSAVATAALYDWSQVAKNYTECFRAVLAKAEHESSPGS